MKPKMIDYLRQLNDKFKNMTSEEIYEAVMDIEDDVDHEQYAELERHILGYNEDESEN